MNIRDRPLGGRSGPIGQQAVILPYNQPLIIQGKPEKILFATVF